MANEPRLYTDLAQLWPLLSPPEHYAGEAEELRELMAEHFAGRVGDEPPTLLELGAGGGHTLYHLCDTFECVAVDLSEPMLDNCRLLNPDVEAVVGDMRTVRLGRLFDAVLLHDAVDYMTTEADARAAMQTVAAHLKPNGIAFIAPTYTRESFVDGEVADDGTSNRDVASLEDFVLPGVEDVTYFSYVHDPDPSDTTIEMILLYLIRMADTRQVEVVEDRHTCGLFSREDWLRFLQHAGLEGRYLEEEDAAWSLFVAVPGVPGAPKRISGGGLG